MRCERCEYEIDGTRAITSPGGGDAHIVAHVLVAEPFMAVRERQAWRNVQRDTVIVCYYCARSEMQADRGVMRFMGCIGRGCHWCGDWDKREALEAGVSAAALPAGADCTAPERRGLRRPGPCSPGPGGECIWCHRMVPRVLWKGGPAT